MKKQDLGEQYEKDPSPTHCECLLNLKEQGFEDE
jgi:hypothetical protein